MKLQKNLTFAFLLISLLGSALAGEKGGNGDGDEFSEALTQFERSGACGEEKVRGPLCRYLEDEFAISSHITAEEMLLEKGYKLQCCH